MPGFAKDPYGPLAWSPGDALRLRWGVLSGRNPYRRLVRCAALRSKADGMGLPSKPLRGIIKTPDNRSLCASLVPCGGVHRGRCRKGLSLGFVAEAVGKGSGIRCCGADCGVHSTRFPLSPGVYPRFYGSSSGRVGAIFNFGSRYLNR
jgi:hypothetical protein